MIVEARLPPRLPPCLGLPPCRRAAAAFAARHQLGGSGGGAGGAHLERGRASIAAIRGGLSEGERLIGCIEGCLEGCGDKRWAMGLPLRRR